VQPPELIALCEVENRAVLEDLANNTYLSKFNYDIVHENSPDVRGIDVCMIYNASSVSLVDYCTFIPASDEDGVFRSRSIMYLRFRICSDTVHVFVNHWPSRRGGVLAGEATRRDLANTLLSKCDSLLTRHGPSVKIILAGDFNCSPEENLLTIANNGPPAQSLLINMAAELSNRGQGSYRYMGRWEMTDQIIVSESVLSDLRGLHAEKNGLQVFKSDFLLTDDLTFPGLSPWPTFRGFSYSGGYSDHLPVVLTLKVPRKNLQE
jgi:predicted extracellular nuclease